MKIGLIDVDGHNFPNLALMKLSAWRDILPALKYGASNETAAFSDLRATKYFAVTAVVSRLAVCAEDRPTLRMDVF